MEVASFKLKTRLLSDTRLIAPLLYSRDPPAAASHLKSNPSLADIMCKGLASRLFCMEKLGLKEATALVKAPRAGSIKTPILEEIAAADQSAKKAKLGPAKPAPQNSALGQEQKKLFNLNSNLSSSRNIIILICS